ncbi:MAG TPA: PorP/SprF family type IX secretion system membrane protein [Bacteroidia bacterium]|nr:PorP/SprF family type IX secretion system membrane protein [Bacteroidia bacterium]
MKHINLYRLATAFSLAFLVVTTATKAQDLHFSQFYESPLNLNPALCGSFTGAMMGEINYRNQWSSVMGSGNGFTTMGATLEFQNLSPKWKKGYLSPGLSFFSDRSGDAKIGTTEITGTMASGIFLNSKSVLSAGIQAGWAQHSIDMGSLQWGEQYVNGDYDANAPTGEETVGNSRSYIDFSGGLLYKYSSGQVSMTTNNEFKLNFGAAFFHVNQPDISFYGQGTPGSELYMRYVAHGYIQFGIPKSCVSIIPGFVYYVQGPSQELNTGVKIRYYVLHDESKYTGINKGGLAFELGAYYRWNDAAIIMMEMKLREYAIGFSYDLNTSQLNTASSGRGAFELSLRYIN